MFPYFRSAGQIVRSWFTARKQRPMRRRERRLRLGLETLEDRVTPSAVLGTFTANTLAATDDGSTGAVSLGFTIDFFGQNYSSAYINNNGNLTFLAAQSAYTPTGLTSNTGVPIIAPYFADVYTDGGSGFGQAPPSGHSGIVHYGTGMVNGYAAFGAEWPLVDYYNDLTGSKQNTFEVVLIDRPDIAEGDFDIEFNYNQVQWETGDASGGSGGLGGSSAVVGYSNGTGTAGTFDELSGSGVPGSFLDSNNSLGLIHNSLNSTADGQSVSPVQGRYIFEARAGVVNMPPTVTAPANQSASEGVAHTFSLGSFADPLTGPWNVDVNWNDGTPDTTYSVSSAGSLGTQSHTYAEYGTDNPTVTVTNENTTLSSSSTFQVAVADGNLSATGTAVSATEGAAFSNLQVGTLTDAAGADSNPSNLSAIITWGGGSPATSPATLVETSTPGVYTVEGSHIYAEYGSYTISVSYIDAGGKTTTSTSTATVADAGLSATGTAVSATEGAAFSNVQVATLTDAAGADSNPSNLSAIITWGEGSPATSPATLVETSTPGVYTVEGSHTYAEQGSYTISVSYIDVGGKTTTSTSTATVADATLSATGTAVSATEGAAFSNVQVGTLTDGAGTFSNLSDLSAIITWGEGSPATSPATLVEQGTSGVYTVEGSHTYAEQGSYTISVSYIDVGGKTTTSTSTATVADAGLSATGTAVSATEGAAFSNVQVGTLTDLAGTFSNLSDLSAIITWGEGSPAASPATLVEQGSTGVYTVEGSHTYAEQGSYTISVSYTDVGGKTTTSTSTATVADAPLTAGTASASGGVEGVTPTTLSATFSDANMSAPVSDFSGTIAWGDGTTTTTFTSSAVSGSGGSYAVSASHLYAEEGTYSVVVTVNDVGGSSTTMGGSAALSGLMSWWKADDTTADSAGSNAGTLENGATYGPGEFGQAFSFESANAYVQAPSNGLPTGGAARTLGLWVNGSSFASQASFAEYGNFGSYGESYQLGALAGGQLFFSQYGNAILGPTLQTGTWYYVAVTSVGNSATLYLDGTAVASGAWTINTPSGSAFDIGNIPGSGQQLNGLVDEVQVYNRALSAAEIQAIYAGASSNTTVADAPLTAGTLTASGGVEGVTPTTLSAAFTDANHGGSASDFTATGGGSVTIHWGDNTTSTGSVSGSGGSYTVSGSHLYAEEGNYNISVVIDDDGGSTTTDTGSTTVTDAPLTGESTASATGGVEGVTAATLSAGTFTDAAGSHGSASDFSVQSVSWGDGGTSTAGLTVTGSGGTYTVNGSHLYGEEGTYNFTITVLDDGGQTATITGSTTVTDAPLTGESTASAAGGVEGVTAATLSAATFTDAAGSYGSAGDFSVQSVTWGDGSTDTTGLTVTGSGGTYTVNGSHLYTEEGPYNFTITVLDDGGQTATIHGSTAVADAPLYSGSIIATAGVEYTTPTTLSATFTDANVNAPTSDFSGTINWGDSNPATTFTSADVTANGNGSYTVIASYQYAEESAAGTPYNITVTINDVGGSTTADNGTTTVADAPLTAGTVTATGGVEGMSPTTLSAAFTDANVDAPTSDFSGTINWGDGNPATTFTSADVTANGNGSFTINASYQYAEESAASTPYNITVTINDVGGSTTTDTGSTTVADAPLTAGTITATGGVEYTTATTLSAAFTDANLNAPTSDFSGTINWGDGGNTPDITTFTSSVVSGSAGSYAVSGSHQYAEEGNYTISVVIDDDGSTTTDYGATVVTDAPLSASGVNVTTTVGTSFSGEVATFTDANPTAPLSDFPLSNLAINWGDGSTSNATSIIQPGGVGTAFDVFGSHTYTAANSYQVSVTIQDVGAVTTFASGLSTPDGLAFDSSGNLYVANYASGTVSEVDAGGGVTTFASGFTHPVGLAFDSHGNLYVSYGDNGGTVGEVSPSGVGTTFAAYYTGLYYPKGLAFDGSGNLYAADLPSGTVTELTPGGAASVFAADVSAFNPFGVPVTNVVGESLSQPFALAFDGSNLYISNAYSGTVTEVTPAGAYSTFASGFNDPDGLAFDANGNLYVANYGSNTVSKVTPAGAVSTVLSGLSGPAGLAFDSSGDLYISNATNNTVTKVVVAAMPTVTSTAAINAAQPTLTTAASGPITLNAGGAPTITDTANLQGGYLPDSLPSSITFTLTLNGNPVPAATQTDPVSGNGNSYTASYTLPITGAVTGTYLWSATYSGDANNLTVTGSSNNETTLVSTAQPTLTTTAGPAAYAAVVEATPGLVSYWQAEGNANDSVGSNNGTLGNDATFAAGEVGQAFSFDGNAYVRAPSTGLPTGSADRTLVAWVNLNSLPTNEAFFAGYGSFGSSTETYQLGATSGGNVFFSQWGSGVGGPVLQTGTWYQVAVTNVGDDVTLYVNGSAVASSTLTINTPAGTSFDIGQIPGDSSRALNGQVDETQVYNRALTPAEIQTLYQAAPGGGLTLGTTAPTLTDTADLEGGYLPDSLGSSLTFTLTLNGNPVAAATQTDPVTANGIYLAHYTLPTTGAVTGTYLWSATYSGDGDNLTVTGASTHETTVVSKAQPTLATVASGPITLSASGAPTISDTADLEGGYLADGLASSITFTLSLNGTPVPAATQTDSVTGNGNTYTASYTLPTSGIVTGTYLWSATYSGDGDNCMVTGPSTNETTVVSKAQPTLTTVASGPITLSAAGAPTISDTADLEGGYLPDGLVSSITFTLTLNGNAVPAATQTDTVTGNGNSYTASYTLPTSGIVTGTYLWSATYSGDGDNLTVTGASTHETTVVSKAQPTLTTVASGPITLSAAGAPTISDTANLQGGYLPDSLASSITFTLSFNGNAVPTATQTDTVTANGNTYTASYTLPTTGIVTGTYLWSATYSGDGDNLTVTGASTHETTVVSPAQPTLTTVASGPITLSASGAPTISDTANLQGGYLADGLVSSITFTLSLNGTPVPAATQTDWVTGNGNTYTASYTLPTSGIVTGTYLWSATYSGDGDNCMVTGASTHETTVVSPAQPTLTTVASGPITLSASGAPTISDTANLQGGYLPDGLVSSITFTLTLNGNAVPAATQTDTVTGNGNSYTASYTLPTSGIVTGTYLWSATYSGDGDNLTVTGASTNETTVVSKAQPTLTTVASGPITLSAAGAPTISDTANLQGGYLPDSLASSITFTLSLNGNAVPTATQTDTVTANGNTYTASYTLPTTGIVTGTYLWSATYSGDGDNCMVTGPSTNETTVVSKAQPTLTTVASGPITLSAAGAPTISDTADLEGGYLPDGLASSITFTLSLNGNAVPTATQTDSVTGNGNTYTASYTLPTSGIVTGTYLWSATYSGDGDNLTVTGASTHETTVVGKAQPTLTTVASGPITLSAAGAPTISDTADLEGGYLPDGLVSSITFTLSLNGNAVPAATQTDTVTANGNTYTVSYTLPTSGVVTGTYLWSATYSGDGDNLTVTGASTHETTVVSKAQPTIFSTASAAVTLGNTPTTLSDSAVLANGYYETGSLVFTLNGPAGFTPVTQSDPLSASGNGTYTASDPLPTNAVPGTYTWHVSYAPDANNIGAVDQGGTAEQTVVTAIAESINGDVYVLNQTASGALTISGNAQLNVAGTLQVDSSSASAVNLSGNADVNAAQTLIVGGDQVSGKAAFIHAVTIHAGYVANPLGNLVAPTSSTPTLVVNLSGSNTQTINPGNYSSITVSGNAQLIMTPGIYIIGSGGVTVSGNGTVTGGTAAGGQGVLIYNTGALTVSGNASVNLTAFSTGDYAGLAIFQAQTDASGVTVSGNANLNLNGSFLYQSNVQSVFTISGNATVEASLVVNELTISGNSDDSAQ